MATKPQSNLPPQSQPWARSIEQSIADLERGTSINGQNSNNNLRQLNSSVQLLSQSIDQLNHAVESKSMSNWYQPGTAGAQKAYNYENASSVTFTAPDWAVSATIMAFSTFSGSDTPTSGYTATVYTRIAGQLSGGTYVEVPNVLSVWSGGVQSGYYAYDTSPAPTVVPFAQKINVVGGTEYTVACALVKGFSGGVSSFDAKIAATVFWSAVS